MAKHHSELPATRFTISNHTLIRILLIILLFGLGLQFLRATYQIWVLLIVAFFLALALNPPVSYLSRKLPRGSRGLATAIAYVVVLSFIGLLAFSITPPLAKQTRELVNNLPSYIEDLKTSDHPMARRLQQYGLVDEITVTKDQIVSGLSNASTPLISTFRRVGTSLAATVTVLVLTFLMLVEGPDWLNKFWSLQHPHKVRHRKQLAMRMYRIVTGYVSGQLLIAFIAGLVSFIMLTILNVPFALPLATIVSLFGLIPLIGATLGGVLLVLVGLFQSTATGVILLVFFVIYQQFENYVLHPTIQSRTVEISPLLVLASALLGVKIAGLLGALLAIPVAASLRILINDTIARHHPERKTEAI